MPRKHNGSLRLLHQAAKYIFVVTKHVSLNNTNVPYISTCVYNIFFISLKGLELIVPSASSPPALLRQVAVAQLNVECVGCEHIGCRHATTSEGSCARTHPDVSGHNDRYPTP